MWVHDRLTCASLHGCVRVCERIAVEAMAVGQGGGGTMVNGKKQGRINKNERAHVVIGSGSYKIFPSTTRRPVSHSGVRGGGGADTTYSLGSKVGTSSNGQESASSPRWPWADVQALVKRG